jgi:signal transduction histidine kinase
VSDRAITAPAGHALGIGMNDMDPRPSAALPPLARARLDDLLGELLTRVKDVIDTQERLRVLLDAVVGMTADLDLDSVLERIVRVACQLADAQYGALGVLGTGSDRRLSQFITHGLTAEQRAAIGDLPRGHGILGVIIDAPEPLRLRRLAEHPQSYGFPSNHPPMNTFLGVPVRIRDRVFGNLYLTEKRSPGGFTAEDEEIVLALAAAAGVVIENARLYDEAARRQRWLEAAAEITAALLGQVQREKAMELVADRAREVSGARAAAVLLQRDGGALGTDVVSGDVTPRHEGGSISLREASPASNVLTEGRSALLTGTEVRPALDDCGLTPRGEPGWPERLLVLPLGGRPADGLLLVVWDEDEPMRESDVPRLETFAEQAALALRVAQAQEDRSKLAVFEDRDRIGRDLHDLVIQRLFAVGLTLDNAARITTRPEVERRITQAVDDIDSTIKDIRRTIFELSGSPRSQDLRAEIGEILEAMSHTLGFTPQLALDGPVDSMVSEEIRPHLLAVLQESLTNAARHADAGAVTVQLEVGEEVVLMVTDDGSGYVDTGRRSGLRNMADRAQGLGGEFTVGRAGPDGGTRLVWRVPCAM